MKEQITELTHPSMYAWFTEYGYDYKKALYNSKNGLENGKLEFKYNYRFQNKISYIKYPYGDVDYFSVSETKVMFLINSGINISDFYCYTSPNFLSFKGFPKKVDSHVYVYDYDEQYSINYKDKDKYKLYLAMWLELLDSVTEKERWEYINEYIGKTDEGYSVIPKELLLEFGVL